MRRVTAAWLKHYNEQRPHQGRACQNQPPRLAFPELPALPPLPTHVQADRWLKRYHHRVFARLVGSDGCVKINQEEYYLATRLSGQKVGLILDASSATFTLAESQRFKQLPIKNLARGTMPIDQFIALSLEQAQSEERKRLALRALWRRSEWDKTP